MHACLSLRRGTPQGSVLSPFLFNAGNKGIMAESERPRNALTHTHTHTSCVSLRTNTTAGTSLTARGTCNVTRTEQATSSTKRNAERALEYLAAVTSPIVPGRCPGRAVGLRCSSFVVAATLTPVCARRQFYHKPAGRRGQALRPLMAYRGP